MKCFATFSRSVFFVIEYGAIVLDPYLQQDIDRLDRVQRQGVRFITRDYRSTVDRRAVLPRCSSIRTSHRFKNEKGISALPSCSNWLKGQYQLCAQFTDHITSNILGSQVTNNSKCYEVPSFHTEQYRHSFFVKTVTDWNHPAACESISLHGWGDTQWPINPPLLSSSHSPSFSPRRNSV